MAVGQLHQRAWTAEDGTARPVVEVVADRAGAKPAVGDSDDQDDADPSK